MLEEIKKTKEQIEYEKMLKFGERMDAMREVIRINNPEKYKELEEDRKWWAPESRPLKYTEWVNKNYPIDPNNTVSLCVYSLLMDMPIEELRKKMIDDFGEKPKTR